MRILIISENFSIGGLETQIRGQVSTLARQGDRFFFATGSDGGSVPPGLFEDGLFSLTMGAGSTFRELQETLERLEDFATRHRVDVIHAHPFYSYIVGALLAWRLRLPYVLTAHGPASLRNVAGQMAEAALTSCVLPGAARVYCVSPESVELIGAAARADIRLLPNGVQIPPERLPGQSGIWGWSGRLEADKVPGLFDLLRKLVADPPARLKIFGQGSCEAEVRSFISEHAEIAAFAQLAGPYADPIEAFACCELIAGMGRVLLEAGSAGLPCLQVGYDGVVGMLDRTGIARAAWTNFSGRNAALIDEDVLHSQIRAWRENPSRFDLRPWIQWARDEEAIWGAYRADLQAMTPREAPMLGLLDDLIRFAGSWDQAPWVDADAARLFAAIGRPQPSPLLAGASESSAEIVVLQTKGAVEPERARREGEDLASELQQARDASERALAAATASRLRADEAEAELELARWEAEEIGYPPPPVPTTSPTGGGEACGNIGPNSAETRASMWELHVRALETSRSWRVTAPLRALRRRLRGEMTDPEPEPIADPELRAAYWERRARALLSSTSWRVTAPLRGLSLLVNPRQQWTPPAEEGSIRGFASAATEPAGSAPHATESTSIHEAELEAILVRYAGRPIVVFSPRVDWDIPLFQRPQHIARALAQRGYLYFFCSPNHGYDKINGFKELEPGLILTDQYALLANHKAKKIHHLYSTGLQWMDTALLERWLDIGDKILYEYIDEIDEAITGYPVPRSAMFRHRALIANETVIGVATADRLMEEMRAARPGGRNLVLATNGVDVSHFTSAGDAPVPERMAAIVSSGRPIIGYFGALATWFDYEAVRHVAAQRPDWDWVLIGPDYDGSAKEAALDALPNVHLLGPIDYSELPKYARHFSVATIPFVVNDITLSTSPIKLFEYMALGIPIVTTALPECRKYRSALIAGSGEEMVERIEAALRLRGDPDYARLLAHEAAENAWTAKARLIAEALEADAARNV